MEKINFCAKTFALLAIATAASACGKTSKSESTPDAYDAGENETHLVVAAPLPSEGEKQRLWVCQGSRVQEGSPENGYLVSIGKGTGSYTDEENHTIENRNKKDTNLTPVGAMRITKKIGNTCAKGMTTRCMQLAGLEDDVNNNTINRGIFIHGTPVSNYDDLGTSASHGCVRMKNEDVIEVYNQVNVGSRVWINSEAIPAGDNPCDLTGKAR